MTILLSDLIFRKKNLLTREECDYFWVHEVEPVVTGVRYSTNSFLMNIPEPVKLTTSQFIGQESNSPNWQEYDRLERYNIRSGNE